jgi:hypothetical protein
MFWINLFFTTVFIIECLLKLLGVGPVWYFLDRWNLFDFIVVVLSIMTIVIDVVTREYDCAHDATAAEVCVFVCVYVCVCVCVCV